MLIRQVVLILAATTLAADEYRSTVSVTHVYDRSLVVVKSGMRNDGASRPTQLTDLPADLLGSVFPFLHPADAVRLRACSSHGKRAFDAAVVNEAVPLAASWTFNPPLVPGAAEYFPVIIRGLRIVTEPVVHVIIHDLLKATERWAASRTDGHDDAATSGSYSGVNGAAGSVAVHGLLEGCRMQSLYITNFGGMQALGVSCLSRCRSLEVARLVECPDVLRDASKSRVTFIGEGFLSNCHALREVTFVNFDKVVTVGPKWLAGCEKLETVRFDGAGGFDSLEVVGSYWLTESAHLQRISFKRFPALRRVGQYWLADCNALESVEFGEHLGCIAVGSYWLAHCLRLARVSFDNAFPALGTVGHSWLSHCSSLTEVSFSGLGGLKSVGPRWLASCPELERVSYDGLASLTAVGDNWMAGCVALRFVDLSALGSLSHVSREWMAGVKDVDEVRLPPHAFLASRAAVVARRAPRDDC
jgi:hypothetical protein